MPPNINAVVPVYLHEIRFELQAKIQGKIQFAMQFFRFNGWIKCLVDALNIKIDPAGEMHELKIEDTHG